LLGRWPYFRLNLLNAGIVAWFDGLFSLYVISALFGLFQGGIVPMYAIIVRESFPSSETGVRLGSCCWRP